MYLREIGKVYLLTADDEKHLARQMEEGLHIAAIEEAYVTTYGHPPSAARVAVSLLEQWDGRAARSTRQRRRSSTTYDKVVVEAAPDDDDDGDRTRVPKWRNPDGPKLKPCRSRETIADPQFRGLIDGEMDLGLPRACVATKLKIEPKTKRSSAIVAALDRDAHPDRRTSSRQMGEEAGERRGPRPAGRWPRREDRAARREAPLPLRHHEAQRPQGRGAG